MDDDPKAPAVTPAAGAPPKADPSDPPPQKSTGWTGWIGGVLAIIPFFFLAFLLLSWPTQFSADLHEFGNLEQRIASLETLVSEADELRIDAEKALKENAAQNENKDGLKTAELEKAKTDAVLQLEELKKELTAAKQTKLEMRKTLGAKTSSFEGRFLSGFSSEARMLLLVVLAGALGSSVAAARSYSYYKGTKQYDPAWEWWYLLRFPVGCGMAVISYVVIRAGFVSWDFNKSNEVFDTLNIHGFVAVGALGGLFTKEAYEKLQLVFEAILTKGPNPTQDQKPKDPTIAKVELAAGSGRRKIKITGSNFAEPSVSVGGTVWNVTRTTATEIEADGTADFPANEVEVKVTVKGAKSASHKVTIP
jgi:IPT/TIG domain